MRWYTYPFLSSDEQASHSGLRIPGFDVESYQKECCDRRQFIGEPIWQVQVE